MIHPVDVHPVYTNVTKTWTKKIVHRWGRESGDVRAYVVGTSGSQVWIRDGKIDLTGPPELLAEIAKAIHEVIARQASEAS